MGKVISNTVIESVTQGDGSVLKTTRETTAEIIPSDQGKYIKLYTNVWCEFNDIPIGWRPLFLELACNMQYPAFPDAAKVEDLQLVNTIGIFGDKICNHLGIKRNNMQKGLKALCDCNAIKRIDRGVYQINPSYAVIGAYNSKGAKTVLNNLKASFDFLNGTSEITVGYDEETDDCED